MTILVVHSGTDLYGASRSILRLSSRLVTEGNRVVVVLPYDGPLTAALLDTGIEVHIDSCLAVLSRQSLRSAKGALELLTCFPSSIRSLRRAIHLVQPDLVHTNTAVVLSSGVAAKLEGIPHIWHVRESFEDFGLIWKLYQWYLFFFSSRIVCVSGAVQKQFNAFIRRRKSIVLHNGIPRAEFAPVSDERVRAFRHEYGLEGYLIVGVVGRLKLVRKGQDTFLKAAAMLAGDYPQTRFVLIGSPFPGNEMHEVALRRLGRELGIEDRVVYTGDVDDIRAAYAALDISVLPSEQPEPFGGVVIESMAAGKPVVGTRTGGTGEQIVHDTTGLLVEPGDALSLAAALRRLMDDSLLRESFGREGRKRFESHFEFEAFYTCIRHTYSELFIQK
jgi:glycosyltransferase involved in cell wall biosynthesis